MPNNTIDLRELRQTLKGGLSPEDELPAPEPELLIETEEAAHPELAGGEDSEAIVAWEAAEFEHHEAGILGRLLFGALLLIGAAVMVFFGNILFTIFLAIAGGLLIALAYRPPRQVRFAVTGRGVTVGSRLYEFAGLESFWLRCEPPLFNELLLHSKHHVMPIIRIPIAELDPVRLRSLLLRFLAEVEEAPSALDVFSRHLGF